MPEKKPAPARRSDALSKGRIVQAAIEMLDEGVIISDFIQDPDLLVDGFGVEIMQTRMKKMI